MFNCFIHEIGDPAEGKSSLVLRFVKGWYLQYLPPTIGGEMLSVRLKVCANLNRSAFFNDLYFHLQLPCGLKKPVWMTK